MDTLLSRTTAPTGTSMQDRIRLAIEQEILSGARAPGSLIDEKALAESFNASRTPVREALLLLASQALVRIVPRAGIYVHLPTAPELVALLEALGELEAALARLAARRATPDKCTALRDALKRSSACATANDRKGYQTANAALHELIYLGSSNPILVEQVRGVRKRLATFRQRGFDQPGRLQASDREHHLIVDAICAGDAITAAQHMREHISVGGEALVELVLASVPAAAKPARTKRSG